MDGTFSPDPQPHTSLFPAGLIDSSSRPIQPGPSADSLILLRQAVDTRPDDPEAAFALAEGLRAAGRIEQAIGSYAACIDRCHTSNFRPPYLVAAYVHLIEALHAIGRDEQGLHAAAQGAPVCADEPRYWLVQGHCYLQLRDYAAALQSFERCLQSSSSEPSLDEPSAVRRDAYLCLAQCHEQTGDPIAAEQAMMNAEWLAGGHWQVRHARLRQLLRTEPLAVVNERLQTVLNEMQGADRRHLAVALAGQLWLWGRFDEAHELLMAAWRSADPPDTVPAAVDVAHALAAMSRTEEAIALLEPFRHEAAAAETTAVLLAQTGDWQSLTEVCDELWQYPDSRPLAASYRAIAHHKRGDFQAAETDYRLAVRLDPENVGAWHQLGMITLSSDRLDEAETAFHEAHRRHPLDPSAPINLARLALMQHNSPGVAHWIEESLACLPTSLSIAIQEQQSQHVLDMLRGTKELGLRRLVGDLCAIWGSFHMLHGDFDEAENRLAEAVSLSPPNGHHHLLLGMCLLRQGERTLATRYFESALRCQPGLVSAQVQLNQAGSSTETTVAPQFAYLQRLLEAIEPELPQEVV